MARYARSSLLVLALLACDEPRGAPPRPEPAPEPPSAPSDCELGAPEVWIETAPERGSLALAAGPGGARVVLATGTRLVTRALSAEGHPTGAAQSSRAPHLDALLALEPRGERHVLIGRGPCEESAHCIVALAFDGGAPVGAPLAAALPEPIRTFRRASSGGEGAPIFVAWSTTGGHRALERLVLDGASLGLVRVPLGDEPASEEAPVEILGLAADGDRWAAIWRRGPTEDVRSSVYLTTAGSHGDVHALHEALAIDAMELSGDALSLIATFEFSRPHHLRLRAGAREPEHARELPAGGVPPAPFDDRERAELDADERGLWLSRRSAAGDPIGARVLVASGAVESAALTRVGEALWVAWQAADVVRGRVVRCPRGFAAPPIAD